MLKKIVVILSLVITLTACNENNKAQVNSLIESKNYEQAQILIESGLLDNAQDTFYNGATAYIMSLKCLKDDCAKNKSQEELQKIQYYLQKSIKVAQIDDGSYIDFYQKTMVNLIKIALKQPDLTSSRYVLRAFVNNNPRNNFIYGQLYKNALKEYLASNSEMAVLNLELIRDLNIELTESQLKSLDLLISLSSKDDIAILKDKIKAFNRQFISQELPTEFLMAFAPALVNYLIDTNSESIINILEQIVDDQTTLFGENIFVIKQDYNIDYYAYGISLIAESEELMQDLEKLYMQDRTFFLNSLQSVVLKIDSSNVNLWKKYLENLYKNNDLNSLYKNINISQLPVDVIISNNDQLLKYAEDNIKEGLVISILNEVVFREDASKKQYTQKTINVVEKALRIEIEKDNLDGIFKYLNYVPDLKDKFKVDLSNKLKGYIDSSWNKNDFNNLNNLILLYKDLNSEEDTNLIANLFDNFLLTEKVVDYFETNNIKTLVNENIDSKIKEEINLKYEYVKSKLSNEDVQAILFSVARKIDGLYSQAKLFSFFVDAFSKDKVDDLIIDSTSVALDNDKNKNLLDLVLLSEFLIEKTGTLPKDYIHKEIEPFLTTVKDIELLWDNAGNNTKKYIKEYNKDIENLISVISNDNKGNKILAAKYVEKISSKQIIPFVKPYINKYKNYVNKIKGDYVNLDGENGPEIVRILPTKNLLKVKVVFISRLGSVETLDIYKLDRGQILSKEIVNYYNPSIDKVKLDYSYTKQQKDVFVEAKEVEFDNQGLKLLNNHYKKVKNLFLFNTKYGIVDQITEKTQDNFHLMPEGTSFRILEELDTNVYDVELNHPSSKEPIYITALYNPETAEFSFGYDYHIELFDKDFSVKAKCQIIDTVAYCAVQNKYWKRQSYSVILKALQVK